MTKHFNRSLVIDEDVLVEKVQSRYFKNNKNIVDEEDETVCHLVSERKSKINDDKPAHIGFCILAWSKLSFLRSEIIKLTLTYINYNF